jgi:hypothetical protein
MHKRVSNIGNPEWPYAPERHRPLLRPSSDAELCARLSGYRADEATRGVARYCSTRKTNLDILS